MKTFYIISLVLVSLLPYGVYAQSENIHLKQVELMKHFLGTWKCEFGKDSSVISETKAFGKGGLEMYQKWFLKDSTLFEQKMIWGYDKKNDKYVCAKLKSDVPEISLIVFWFTSPDTCLRVPYEFISNPELADSRAVYDFKSEQLMVSKFYSKDNIVGTFTWHKINE